MNFYLTPILFFFTGSAFSQSRLVFNNDGYLVIEGGAMIVIARNNPDAITQLGAGGRIISEAETDYVQWNIANAAAGAFTIPFARIVPSLAEIPLTFTVNSAGDAGGKILFSTYRGGWDNDAYKPAEVANMQGQDGDPNNSENVVDRFWILEPNNYITKPDVTINFTYIDDEHSAASNTIIEGSLFAQRWNSTTSQWGDWFGIFGTANTVNNTVSSGAVTAANYFRVWTLVDQDNPLPVELISFTVDCRSGIVHLQWTTATEINNDYFTIQRVASSDSPDGGDLDFANIVTIDGAGNSNTLLKYSYFDQPETRNTKPETVFYYRLLQTDFDGITKYYNPVHVYSCNEFMPPDSMSAYVIPENLLVIEIISKTSFDGKVCLFDMLLKKIIDESIHVAEGENYKILNTRHIRAGIYVLSVSNNEQAYVQKVSFR